MRRGRFITLEGIEGAGKSTIARLVCEWLARRGLTVRPTREPGGGNSDLSTGGGSTDMAGGAPGIDPHLQHCLDQLNLYRAQASVAP